VGVLAYVGLGANLGDAPATLNQAAQAMRDTPGVESLRLSPLYRSAPLDATGPDFYNAVAELSVTLTPLELLQALQAIEQVHGRERPYRNAPRTLDLDLLLHGTAVQATAVLTLPHPRLHQRAFVLRPLLDLAPNVQAPGLGPLVQHWPAVQDQVLEKLPWFGGRSALAHWPRLSSK